MLSDFPEPEEVEMPERYMLFDKVTGEPYYYTLMGDKVWVEF
jgi:hypothetical protein